MKNCRYKPMIEPRSTGRIVKVAVERQFFPMLTLVMAICLTPSFSASQSTSPGAFPSPAKTATFPADFKMGQSNASFPVASNGYLLSFSRSIQQALEPTSGIFMSSLTTSQRSTIPFWVASASSIHLDAGAVTVGGNVLVAGSYLRSTSPQDLQNFHQNPSQPQVSNFVAELNASGLVSMHDLQGFTPERICSASDKSFWVLGQQWPLEQSRKYFLLQHYSSSGTLIQAYLPHIGKPDSPDYRIRNGRGSHDAAFLICGDNSVGVFLQRTGGYVWAEIDLSGGNQEIRKVTALPQAVPTGMALFSRGTVYASFRAVSHKDGATSYGAPLGIYKLNMSQNQAFWQAVPGGSDATPNSTLLGRHDGYLVHLKGTAGPVKDPTVYWTQVVQNSVTSAVRNQK